jgi:hypothetical protein
MQISNRKLLNGFTNFLRFFNFGNFDAPVINREGLNGFMRYNPYA